MFKVGDLVDCRLHGQLGIVLWQDTLASPAETQIFIEGKKKWVQSRKLRLLSGNK
jgi:hypothetical protein